MRNDRRRVRIAAGLGLVAMLMTGAGAPAQDSPPPLHTFFAPVEVPLVSIDVYVAFMKLYEITGVATWRERAMHAQAFVAVGDGIVEMDVFDSAFRPFRFEDDGKGMDEETRKRVFEPFFSTKFTGRGLGMAATYGIIKNHDGWVSISSELGKGKTVFFYLPEI